MAKMNLVYASSRDDMATAAQDCGGARHFVRTLFGERRTTLLLVSIIWALWICLFATPYILVTPHVAAIGLLGYIMTGASGYLLSLLLLLGIAWTMVTHQRHPVFKVAVGTIAVSALQSLIDLAVFDLVSAIGNLTTWTAFPYAARWADNFSAFMLQFSLIAVIFWTFERAAIHRARGLELQSTKIAAAEANYAATIARLAALRYQLNPHFLFNTLNSISSLVITNRNEQAEEMLSRLADFLRVTLEPESGGQTLEHELETVAAYLAIEQIRVGERLAIDIICPAELRDCETPHFILQPLVENAIKHGAAKQDRLVTVRIEAVRDGEDLIISVEDDGGAHKSSPGGTGIGLRNVSERLQTLYGSRGKIETNRRDTGFLSTIRFPFRQNISSQ
jgi:signal transduction histidine kinase